MTNETLTTIEDSKLIISPHSETQNPFTFKDKQLLSENTDWTEFFEDVENLHYRIVHERSIGDYLIFDNKQITPLNTIRNYYSIPTPKEIEEIPETELYNLNGKMLKINDKYQRTRFKNGQPLESAVQLAHTMANIPFCGNPMKLEHYPHSIGLHVDVETYYSFFECTNPKRRTNKKGKRGTYLNDEAMDEKLDYFLKIDPHHKKKWFLITSFKNWSKRIAKRIRDLNITVIILGATVNSRNHNQIAQLLSALLVNLNQLAKNQYEINKYKTNTKLKAELSSHNIQLLNSINNTKNLYQNLLLIEPLSDSDVCGGQINKNESGLSG